MKVMDYLKSGIIKKNDELNSIYALLIIFLTSSALSTTSVYAITLFLSTYPRNWLVSFLCAQAITVTLSSFAIIPTLKNHIKRNALIIMGSFIFLMAIFFCFHLLLTGWLPFIISIVVGMTGTLCSLIGWNMIPLAFGLRKYKDIARYAQQAAEAGVICGSLFIPLTLHYFPVRALLIVSLFCFTGASVFIYKLSLLQQPEKLKITWAEKSLPQLQLFKKIVFYTLLVIATQSLIDYLFKFELAKHYKNNHLATFQGYYLGITNTLGLLVGLASTKYLLRKIRIEGLLYLTQSILLSACIVALLWPSLWSLTILASIRVVFYFNYAALALEIIMSFFSSNARIEIKIRIKTMITPLSVITVYLVLLFIANRLSEINLCFLAALLCSLTFYTIYQVSKGYKTLLQQEKEFQRFNLIVEQNAVQSNAIKIFPTSFDNTRSDVRSIPFLVSQINETKNPTLFIKLLAAYPGEESEEAILSLINQSDVWKRTIAAKESQYRACQFPVSLRFKQQATALTIVETEWIVYLNQLLTKTSDVFIQGELLSRIQLAKQRALSWLAVATDPLKISRIIPTLMRPSINFAYQQAHDKALELLEVYITDSYLIL